VRLDWDLTTDHPALTNLLPGMLELAEHRTMQLLSAVVTTSPSGSLGEPQPSSRALLDTDYEVLRHRRANMFPSGQRLVRDKDHRSGADWSMSLRSV